jgi:hypothetical protein
MDAINISTHFPGRHAVGSRRPPEKGGDLKADPKRKKQKLVFRGRKGTGRGEKQGGKGLVWVLLALSKDTDFFFAYDS